MTETMTAAEYQAQGGKPPKLSKSEQIARTFALHIRARKLPAPRCKFHPDGELRFMAGEVVERQNKRLKRPNASPSWRFDFAWPELMVAVEVEGVTVRKGADGKTQLGGRHAHITGFKDDCEKYAWAAVMGWRVLRFEQSQVVSGFAVDMLVRLWATLEAPRVYVSGLTLKPEDLEQLKPGPIQHARPFADLDSRRFAAREAAGVFVPPQHRAAELQQAGHTDELNFGGVLDRDPF